MYCDFLQEFNSMLKIKIEEKMQNLIKITYSRVFVHQHVLNGNHLKDQ